MGDLGGELFASQNAIGDTISLGYLSEADEMLAHGRELYDQLEDPGAAGEYYLAEASHFLSEKGELDQALRERRALLEKASASGSELDMLGHRFFLSRILYDLGEYEQAADLLGQAVASADEADWFRDGTRALMANVLAKQGQIERARNLIEEAQAIQTEQPRAFAALIMGQSNANVLAAEGRWEDAFETFKKTTAKLAEAGIRTIHAGVKRDWAEAHLARGEAADSERAKELYREALAEYVDMGATGWIERVQTRLAEIEN